jgi:hypothetical protein
VTVSAFIHWLIFGHAGMSICGRAYRLRHIPFWGAWCRGWDLMARPFMRSHCRQSFFWHIERQAGPLS